MTVAVTVTNHIDGEFSTIRADVSGMKSHEQKVDSAITVLTDQQNDQTQRLIHELLASAQSAQRTDLAIRAIRAASALTATLKQEKRTSPPEFFQNVVMDARKLDQSEQPDLRNASFDLQNELAEYRSALVSIDGQKSETLIFKPSLHAITMFPDGHLTGGVLDMSNISGDAIILGKGIRPHPLPSLQGTVIKGGTQTLDGFDWQHVIFIGMRIKYKGGEVKLDNVVFVNCTFELQKDERGARVADYIALAIPTLNIEAMPC